MAEPMRGTQRGLSGALVVLSGKPEPTQEDQILQLLADGEVWSSYELHRQVFCVLHSRVASLRKKLAPYGFDIAHTGGGAGTREHHYQLVSLLKEETGVGEDAAALRCPGDTGPVSSLSGGARVGESPPPGDDGNPAAHQLTLEVAA